MSGASLSPSPDLAGVFREDRYDILLALLVALLATAPFVRTNAFAAAAIFALAVASMLVTFLFRYTPCALLWLGLVWLAKRFWQHKLPPPKLYKPPKA